MDLDISYLYINKINLTAFRNLPSKTYFFFNYSTFFNLFYICGELKNPLLVRNIIIPIIGPMPNINNTIFAVFLFS